MQGKGGNHSEEAGHQKPVDLTGFQGVVGLGNCPRLIWLTTAMALEQTTILMPHKQTTTETKTGTAEVSCIMRCNYFNLKRKRLVICTLGKMRQAMDMRSYNWFFFFLDCSFFEKQWVFSISCSWEGVLQGNPRKPAFWGSTCAEQRERQKSKLQFYSFFCLEQLLLKLDFRVLRWLRLRSSVVFKLLKIHGSLSLSLSLFF